MEDQTTIIEKQHPFKKPKGSESHFFGLTARSIITLIVVATLCYMSIMQIKVEEPLYTLAGMIVAYYFGQNAKTIKQENQPKVQNEKVS